MNEAGPSNQNTKAIDPATRVESNSSAAPVHPLVWPIQVWVIASVTSLVLAVGLSRALRGAFVGAEAWIIRVDHSAALTSQVAAISTALLLVYMGLLAARAARSLLLGVGAALLGSAPTLIVFFAQRVTLPEAHNWISAICAGFAALLCATQMRSNPMMRTIVALGGLSLLGAALRSGGIDGRGSELTTQIGEMLEGFFAWSTLGLSVCYHLWKRKSEPWRGALLMGATVLLAATVPASTQPHAERWLLLLGRTLAELAPLRALGPGSPLAVAGALMLVVSNLFSRPGSLGQLICALLALAVVAPPSPLVIGWLTLSAYCAVVIGWQPMETSSANGAHT